MSPEELAAIKSSSDWRSTTGRLLAHIDQQAAQIEALKEMLIQERLKNLEACNGECGKIEDPDCEKCEYEFCRRQLKAEMPEVEW